MVGLCVCCNEMIRLGEGEIEKRRSMQKLIKSCSVDMRMRGNVAFPGGGRLGSWDGLCDCAVFVCKQQCWKGMCKDRKGWLDKAGYRRLYWRVYSFHHKKQAAKARIKMQKGKQRLVLLIETVNSLISKLFVCTWLHTTQSSTTSELLCLEIDSSTLEVRSESHSTTLG